MAVLDTAKNGNSAAECCGAPAAPRITLGNKIRSMAREAGVPVWGIAGILGLLALVTDGQAYASALFTIDAFIGILPFILASVAKMRLFALYLGVAGTGTLIAAASWQAVL